jgi:hypothetical protein
MVRDPQVPELPAAQRCYHAISRRPAMTDLLIRDVPDEVLAGIDERAQRLGLSRAEYLRRTLAREAAVTPLAVTSADLQRFADRFADLADPQTMRQAWE